MNKQDQTINRPNCPDCGHAMNKFGTGWSGRNKTQRWQCPKCGRVVSTKIQEAKK